MEEVLQPVWAQLLWVPLTPPPLPRTKCQFSLWSLNKLQFVSSVRLSSVGARGMADGWEAPGTRWTPQRYRGIQGGDGTGSHPSFPLMQAAGQEEGRPGPREGLLG